MKKGLLLFLLICAGHQCFVAQRNIDSLYTVWQDESMTDSIRALAYHDVIWYGHLYTNPDTAFIMAEDLVQFGKKNNLPSAEANGFNIQGSSFWFKGEFDKAQDYYTKNLELQKEMGNQKGVGTCLNNIGLICQLQDNYPKALEYFNRSLKIREEIGDRFGAASTLGNIGGIHISQEDYELGLEYTQRSLEMREEIDDKRGIAGALTNIGLIYQYTKDYEKALDYHRRSLELNREVNHPQGIANSIGNIGFINLKQGNYDEALMNFEESLAIQEQLGNPKGITTTMINLGNTYREKGAFSAALENCQEGYDLALSNGFVEEQKNACACTYETYKELGNDSKALEYYEEMVVLHDSLQNKETTKKITQLEMQYSFDKKEAKAQLEQEKKDAETKAELRRQRMLRNGFIGGFALVLLFAGVFFRQRNRISKEKAVSEGLLLNILPEEVAQELKTKGHTEAQLIDEVTVLFTDFKGFTSLSEQLSPKDLVSDLHECFSAFDTICEKYGIEKIKTIGDAFMAAGGLPSPNSSHAMDVTSAALEMISVMEKFKLDKMSSNLPYFEARIGIHTGPVVAGIVGVKKFQYDIWGDTVNTASRMESSGEVGKVNISETTYQMLVKEPSLTFESRGKVAAKGKGEIEMYFVR